jgi:hypothetical protein
MFACQKRIKKGTIFEKSVRRRNRERTKQISPFGSQMKAFSCMKNATKNDVHSCRTLDAKRHYFESIKKEDGKEIGFRSCSKEA